MRVGDTRTDDGMMLVATMREYREGYMTLRHARCGRVVFKRKPGADGKVAESGGEWVITECANPDKE